jgi:hypothetical protein
MTTPDELRKQVEHGIEMARDPQNAQITTAHQSRETTIYSPWLLQICRICRHTFREGDAARPDPQRPGRMLHEDADYQLFCWSKAHQRIPPEGRAQADNPTLREALLRGLQSVWNSMTEAEPVRPGAVEIGRRCPICRHTVRAGDQIVRCPCGRQCGGVFHQDITRHLTCWSIWNNTGERNYCPFTGAPYLQQGEMP